MNSIMRCFTVALVILVTFTSTGCSEETTSEEPGILVSTEWLQHHLNDPDLVLLHSGTSGLFDSVHIPGARLISPREFTMNTELNRNEMPPADSIVVLLREAGVNTDSKIVLYHEDIGLLNRTARVFLTLDHLGLGEQTRVLNGGLTAWTKDGNETTDMPTDFLPGKLEISEVREVFVSAEDLDSQRWSNKVVVIDARSDEEYYGTSGFEEVEDVGGHIEGAYLLSYLEITYDESPYLFKSDSEMAALFRRSGMDPGKLTLIYCNSGIKGSLNYLAARHLGYPALLYDGSYDEWVTLDMPSIRPVAIPDPND